MRKPYPTEEEISPEYVQEVAERLLPELRELTGKETSKDMFLLRSVIKKVLIHCNRLDFPAALDETVIEMCARQYPEYERGLTSERNGVVKRVQRGGFTQDIDTAAAEVVIPRGTQFMSDYIKYLNRFRRMKVI
ncbi:Uncharacterized protein B5E38_4985 [Bacillus cereus]|nr:Uncharacterized protein B5E38_4985 [Bacillus cereus]ARO65072.1 Uncharacterized protein B5E39_2701 [Bacillus cereus]